MKAWKILVPLTLAGLAIGGFAIAKMQTNGGKGSEVPPPQSIQYAEVESKNGGAIATFYDSGSPIVSLNAADKSAAIELVHARMKQNGVPIYFIFSQISDGTWFAQGYKDGASASDEMGPYASEQAATSAGSTWMQLQLGAAVGGPGCPTCAAVGAKAKRPAMGGGLTGGRTRRGVVICPPGWHIGRNGTCYPDQIAT